MIRRLSLILIAATQIAALPVTLDPTTTAIGLPLTLAITLPAETTKLVGLPDLGTFALLEPPIQRGNLLTLRLLPLRPGDQKIPPLPFQTGPRRESTPAIPLTVEAPAPPETPHPLRPLPTDIKQDNPSIAWGLRVARIAGFATLGLMLAAALWSRRSTAIKPADDPTDPLSLLAAAAQKFRSRNDPDWDRFFRQLDRIRFSPLPHSDSALEKLRGEFDRLKGETA